MSQNTIQNKIILPLVTLLKQGVEPYRLSLGLDSDSAIGSFPALEIATIACKAVAALYRLNLPAIQLANYLVFPMQIILFSFSLYRGNSDRKLFGQNIKKKLLETFDLVFLPAIQELTQYFILASLGWALALAPLFAVLYFFLKS